MFYVMVFEFAEATMKKTLFRSMLERECWDYIRSRLQHYDVNVRVTAEPMFVVNDSEQFMEAPEDIHALRRYVQVIAA